MDREQMEMLNHIDSTRESIVMARDLIPHLKNRTLLYGYTCNRETFHVYLKNNKIYTIIYGFKENPYEVKIESNEDYIPDKRLYPERCDYNFCKLLKIRGYDLPFTTWTDNVKKQDFYGKTLEDFDM